MRRTLLSSALRHGSPLLLACLLAPLTHAQEARPPRAVPVEESASAARPPRAIPVDDDAKPATRGPAPTPAPPRAIPAPENDPGDAPAKPAATPSVPKRTPKPPAKTADPETDLFEYSEYVFQRGDYRLSAKQYGEYLSIYPQGRFRDEARFKLAESHYRNKFNDLALQEFDIYVRDFPNGKNRAIAYYHAGEAHYRIASQLPAAERAPRVELAFNAYRASLTISRSGPYACYAAFRLGTYAYNAAQDSKERYQEAVRFFTIAASQSPKDQEKIRATALFFLARSHRYLSQKPIPSSTQACS
jgi:TolA-binding protein